MTTSFGTNASRTVLEKLEQHGYEAVFVGGAVRDFLLGKEASDIDVATSAEPVQVKEVFPNTVDVGIEHGTVLVIEQHEHIEVTTYRTEGTYTDHRRPDTVQFVKSLREDLLRRDFTINAMAIRGNGELVDFFQGQADLHAKRIKSVGNPVERFQEDALRMVRAVRFSSALNFTIEDKTLEAIEQLATLLQTIAIERIKIELDKLFLGHAPNRAFNYMEKSKLSDVLPCYPYERQWREQLQSFTTTLEGWAFWMIASAVTATTMMRSFKLSNDETAFLKDVYEAFAIRMKRLYTTFEVYSFSEEVLTVTERIYQAKHDTISTPYIESLLKKKSSLPIQSKKELVVDGKTLMKWEQKKGGQWTGRALKAIEEAVVMKQCTNELRAIKTWYENQYKPMLLQRGK